MRALFPEAAYGASIAFFFALATGAAAQSNPGTAQDRSVAAAREWESAREALRMAKVEKSLKAARRAWEADPQATPAGALLAAAGASGHRFAGIRPELPAPAVRVSIELPVPEPPVVGQDGYIAASSANIRAAASTSAPVHDRLEINRKVQIREEQGDWYRIDFQGQKQVYAVGKESVAAVDPGPGQGFVHRSLVSKTALTLAWVDGQLSKVEATNLDLKTRWLERKVALAPNDHQTWALLLTTAIDAGDYAAALRAAEGLNPTAWSLQVTHVVGCPSPPAQSSPIPTTLKGCKVVSEIPFPACPPCVQPSCIDDDDDDVDDCLEGSDPSRDRYFAEVESANRALENLKIELKSKYPYGPWIRINIASCGGCSELQLRGFQLPVTKIPCPPRGQTRTVWLRILPDFFVAGARDKYELDLIGPRGDHRKVYALPENRCVACY